MSVGGWILASIGLLASPATGGASLILCGPQAKELWDNSDIKKAKQKQANKQANSALNAQASKEIQEEIRKLREERDKQNEKNKKTEERLHDFKQKLNNQRPRAAHETDDYLKKQITILTAQLDKDKSESKNLSKRIEELTKRLPQGNNDSWTLPELFEFSTTTKVIMAGSVVLLVYLLSLEKKRRVSKNSYYELFSMW